MASEGAAELLAGAMSECMNALALVASPRALARARATMPRDGVQRALDASLGRLLELVEVHGAGAVMPGGSPLESAAPMLERVRGLVREWPFGAAPAPMLVDCARAALGALGVPAPRDGAWDALELPDPTLDPGELESSESE